MNKKLILSFLFSICGILFSQEANISDITLYNNISQSFENKYYPKTVENVDTLQKLYPESVFLQPALVYKAKALMNLTHYNQAISTLHDAIAHMHTGKNDFAVCFYLLGESYFHLKNYKDALDCFYMATKVSLIDEQTEFYNSSILYSAKCFFELKEYEKASYLYEYVISNGKNYTQDEYENAFNNLLFSYKEIESYEKIISLADSFNGKTNIFNENTIKNINIYKANAYEKTEEYNNAFLLYSKMIEEDDEELSVYALKKIYSMYHENKIDDMSYIFEKAFSKIENNKKLLNELLLRTGIDEYNRQNYKKADEYLVKVDNNDFSNIYRAKIILDTDFSKEGGKKAENILKKCKNHSDSYYSLMIQCKIQQDQWEFVPELFSKIENPDEKDIYINSAYYYKNGDFDKVAAETGILYPSALCKLGKYQEAVTVFSELDEKNILDDKSLIEYSKALFFLEKYEESYNVAIRSNDLQKDYIAGLCKINMGNLNDGRNHLMAYMKKASNSNEFNELALYYKGYIEYWLGEYRNAFASFIRFISEADEKYVKYIGYSYKFAAISALENNDFDNAVFQAFNVVRVSKESGTEEDEFKAVRFCFEVLNDSQQYEKAIELLLPYTRKQTDFAAEALYKMAKTYEKQGNIKKADLTYSEICTYYPDSEFAEEALYRNSEIFYLNEEYYSAYRKFNEYINKYKNGKFSDGALYFSGDCALRLGEINKAVMINKNMISKFPDSKYAYNAKKNLISAYYEQEEYENALEIALDLAKTYGEQAELDNINIKIQELERIVNGTDRFIAEKITEFELAGGFSTVDGRKTGSQLVKLYNSDPSLQEEAYTLAVELIKLQTEDEELFYAAENAEFVGDFLSNKLINDKAAEYYLLAAKYYRSVDNSLRAAAVLYGAVDAFNSADLIGDARETAALLKELYPDSKYAEKVDRIVR